MKKLLIVSVVISMILGAFGCHTEIMATVLDDISRDTYENNAKAQRRENIDDPAYQEPLTYDQYQIEREALVSDTTE